MEYAERNTVWGIRDRTLKNLKFIKKVRNKTDTDVHVVTHLVTSLLGLIVFPYEEILVSHRHHFRDIAIQDLVAKGWPEWKFDIGQSDSFEDHMRHLRNAISHRGVFFSSDSRKPEDVDVTFMDRPSKKAPWNWGATIRADRLEEFAIKFAEYLQQWEKDYS